MTPNSAPRATLTQIELDRVPGFFPLPDDTRVRAAFEEVTGHKARLGRGQVFLFSRVEGDLAETDLAARVNLSTGGQPIESLPPCDVPLDSKTLGRVFKDYEVVVGKSRRPLADVLREQGFKVVS